MSEENNSKGYMPTKLKATRENCFIRLAAAKKIIAKLDSNS
jgi:hypothetical protein